jgi:hypothetical protein
MNIRNLGAGLLAAMTLSTMIAAPLAANAQRDWERDRQDRRDNDRDWRDNRNNRDWQDRNGRNNNRNDWRNDSVQRRQDKKNEWRNIAIGAGGLGLLGLLKKDNTLTFAGGAGALYSLNRYEQDRKSQSRLERTRSTYFSKPYFYRDGVRYDRRTVNKNGQKYYQFARR